MLATQIAPAPLAMLAGSPPTGIRSTTSPVCGIDPRGPSPLLASADPDRARARWSPPTVPRPAASRPRPARIPCSPPRRRWSPAASARRPVGRTGSQHQPTDTGRDHERCGDGDRPMAAHRLAPARERRARRRAPGRAGGSAAGARAARGPGSSPSSSTSRRRAARNASRASVWRPARYSASIRPASRRSRSGCSDTSRSSSGTSSAPPPAASSASIARLQRGRAADSSSRWASARPASRQVDHVGPRQAHATAPSAAARSTTARSREHWRPRSSALELVDVELARLDPEHVAARTRATAGRGRAAFAAGRRRRRATRRRSAARRSGHSASISWSRETTWFACSSSIASSVRCLRPPSASGPCRRETSSGPSTANRISANQTTRTAALPGFCKVRARSSGPVANRPAGGRHVDSSPNPLATVDQLSSPLAPSRRDARHAGHSLPRARPAPALPRAVAHSARSSGPGAGPLGRPRASRPRPARPARSRSTRPRTRSTSRTATTPTARPPAGTRSSVIDARHCNARDVSRCKGPWPTITVGERAERDRRRRARPTRSTSPTSATTRSRWSTAPPATRRSRRLRADARDRSRSGRRRSGIFADHANHTVYVANFDDGTVSMIDSATCNGDRSAGCPTSAPPTVAVGGGPGDVDVNQRTHTAYVTNLTGLSAFDANTCNATGQTGCGAVGDAPRRLHRRSVRVLRTVRGQGRRRQQHDLRIRRHDTPCSVFDGRPCNAGDLAGCATDTPGDRDAVPATRLRGVDLWSRSTLRSTASTSPTRRTTRCMVIDANVCNGRHLGGVRDARARARSTPGTNPESVALDPTDADAVHRQPGRQRRLGDRRVAAATRRPPAAAGRACRRCRSRGRDAAAPPIRPSTPRTYVDHRRERASR